MNQELVDKAIDTAAECLIQANAEAERAGRALELAKLTAGMGALLSDSGAEPPSPVEAYGVASLTAITYQLNEISNLLRAIVAHTGAALPSSSDKQDLFDQMFAAPEDIKGEAEHAVIEDDPAYVED